ncbi:unnamed protein product [Thelazia callipaeda]|uniref:PlsC domain-containing protein n=1 Tax=Thelazia callipaeda TaxID=103827 RepID=A0A0N5CL53_THECL|nr:unnamed protein product [Thelazia callipaeda]
MIETSRDGTNLSGTTVSAEDSFFIKVMNSSVDIRRILAIIGALYWIFMTVFIVPITVTATFLIVMLPVLCFSNSWFNWLDHKLCRMVNNHWSSALQITGTKIIEYGDDISKITENRVLFLANHLGIADHFVIMSALRDKGTVVEKYLWVIFNIWKMTPLGVMWAIHGNFFVKNDKAKREKMIENFKKHLILNYWKYDHRWIIMYPEGARLYLIKKRNAQYAIREGYKVFRHCALPRSGAAHAALQVTTDSANYSDNGVGCDASLDYIVDCTLGYQKGKVPSIAAWMFGEFLDGIPNVAVHYRIHQTKAEWKNEEALRDWLYKIYEEKDELLDRFYNTGAFPMDSREHPVVLHTSISKCLYVEVFWLVLFYIHYVLWLKPVGNLIYRCCAILWFAVLNMFLDY